MEIFFKKRDVVKSTRFVFFLSIKSEKKLWISIWDNKLAIIWKKAVSRVLLDDHTTTTPTLLWKEGGGFVVIKQNMGYRLFFK